MNKTRPFICTICKVESDKIKTVRTGQFDSINLCPKCLKAIKVA